MIVINGSSCRWLVSSLARRGYQDIIASSRSLCAQLSLSDAERRKSIAHAFVVWLSNARWLSGKEMPQESVVEYREAVSVEP